MATADELRKQLDEAKLRVNDLTRNLNESVQAEGSEAILAELQAARRRVIELERELAKLESTES